MFSPSLGWQAHMEVTPCLIALRSQTTLLVSGVANLIRGVRAWKPCPVKCNSAGPGLSPIHSPIIARHCLRRKGIHKGDSATQKTPSEHPCDPFGLPMRISWAHNSPGPWRCPRVDQGFQQAVGSPWHGEKGTDMDRQCL